MKMMFDRCILPVALICLAVVPIVAIGGPDQPNRKELVDQLYPEGAFRADYRFITVTGSAAMFTDPTCQFPPDMEVGENERCIEVPDRSQQVFFNERDINSVGLPGNTFKDYVCPAFLIMVRFDMTNDGEAPNDSWLLYNIVTTIESDVLNDPDARDEAGNPLNGRLDVRWGGEMVWETLVPGAARHETRRYTRECNAGVSKQQLGYLPERVLDNLFRKPMTIHMNIDGRLRGLDYAHVIYAMRVMGN
ncbi:MAG: hypothetical protein HUJ31_15080 [Pseudomonadales bacterium]|nr:hypothetical protein [Pseudomonadales bacterium]